MLDTGLGTIHGAKWDQRFLQMRTKRTNDVNYFVLGHKAQKWQIWDLKSGVSDAKTYSRHHSPSFEIASPVSTFILSTLKMKTMGWAVRHFWCSSHVRIFILGSGQGRWLLQNIGVGWGGGGGHVKSSRYTGISEKAFQQPRCVMVVGWTLVLPVWMQRKV